MSAKGLADDLSWNQASLESAGSSEPRLEKAIHLEHGPSTASCRVEETTYQKPVEDAR